MMSVVDTHQHVLWGLDDGPESREEMHAMLNAASKNGITRIIATPHVVPGIEFFDEDKYRLSLKEAAEYARGLDKPIDIHGGAEILFTEQTAQFLIDGRVPTLDGTNRVLVEFSPDVEFDYLKYAINQIICVGFLPVLAHVERYRCLMMHPSRAIKLRERNDIFYQINARPAAHPEGFFLKRFLDVMFKSQAVDALGTDAHNCTYRPPEIMHAIRRISDRYGSDYAASLVDGSFLIDSDEMFE